MLKLSNKIIRGNSLEEIKKIPNNSFDLVFADPPYNMQIGKTLTRPDTSKVNGVNDKWVIPGLEHFPNNEVKVFNRWGNLVYEAKNYQNNWTGVSIGKFTLGTGVPTGTYFYIIDLKNGEKPLTGYVYIAR